MKNTFFCVNNFYILLENPQNTLSYFFHYIQQKYYLEIKNKEHQKLTIFFKVIKNNKSFDYKIIKESSNFICLNSFDQLNFENEYNMPSTKDILKLFPHFDIQSYKQNLNFNIKDFNNDFFIYHWFYCGQYDKYQFWKYILYKNAHYFFEINDLINYSIDYKNTKKYTLTFIDDRFDNIFIYILIMFKYCINNDWNLHIFSQLKHYDSYKHICDQLNIEFKFHEIEPFLNVNCYSNYLKSIEFWNILNEEYTLIFQYDSCAFQKFDKSFLDYFYLGAQWPVHIQQVKGIFNGNGGTSLRHIKTMAYICEKYFYNLYDEKTPEDIYFSKYLYQENLLENSTTLCNRFSMENIEYEDCVFGHAIYESIQLKDLETFFIQKIKKIL